MTVACLVGEVPAQSSPCRKIPFATATEAHWHGRGLQSRGVAVYRCDRCLEYHLTSENQTERKRRLKALRTRQAATS
jgi:hypothetical protein